MKWFIFPLLAVASLLTATAAKPAPQVGDIYELTLQRDSKEESSDGSSGSTHDKWSAMERVIAVREDGLELEYDHPSDVSAEEKASDWQFPVRVFKPAHGPIQLLNTSDLETRIEAWLKAAKLTRAMCGRWIFTWNAFQIECDPKSVIKIIEGYDLRSGDMREGALYQMEGALGSSPIAQQQAGTSGPIFTAQLNVDPDAFRRSRAEADVVIGEIMRKPVTLDAAMQARAKESISGTIAVTFETDSLGQVRRRTTLTRLQVKEPDGRLTNKTITEVLERRVAASAVTSR
jgi:hypothetical protein